MCNASPSWGYNAMNDETLAVVVASKKILLLLLLAVVITSIFIEAKER